MEKITFRIRRRIIVTFLFTVLAVLVFAAFSFQVHREIGHRLRLLELADDLYQDILEMRRFEKNFLLYKQPASLAEAKSYAKRVQDLYLAREPEFLHLKTSLQGLDFSRTLERYQDNISQIEARLAPAARGPAAPAAISTLEESLRSLGTRLVEVAEGWAKEERLQIDRLFQQAFSLFVSSMVVFLFLGILVAFYIARLLVRPLVQMQQAMEKIAQGDFTPIPEPQSRSEEFFTLFRAFNRMIHELEAHQEELVQSRKIAAVGTLTAGVAHELNNPINNIVLTAETLKEDFGELPAEEAQGMIQDILSQSERAAEIVKGLLDFARSEQPEFETVSLGAVITDTLKLVRNQLSLSGIQEEMEIPPELPPIFGDRKSLQQVFLNLYINAIQAMPDGGTLRIRACASRHCPWGSPAPRHWVKVEVRDTGVGIAPSDLSRIFDPFFSTKAVGKGTGLGLSVTYGIIQKHGGHIEVQSEKGAGTAFTMLFPVKGRER